MRHIHTSGGKRRYFYSVSDLSMLSSCYLLSRLISYMVYCVLAWADSHVFSLYAEGRHHIVPRQDTLIFYKHVCRVDIWGWDENLFRDIWYVITYLGDVCFQVFAKPYYRAIRINLVWKGCHFLFPLVLETICSHDNLKFTPFAIVERPTKLLDYSWETFKIWWLDWSNIQCVV